MLLTQNNFHADLGAMENVFEAEFSMVIFMAGDRKKLHIRITFKLKKCVFIHLNNWSGYIYIFNNQIFYFPKNIPFRRLIYLESIVHFENEYFLLL